MGFLNSFQQPLWPPGSPVHLKAAAYLALVEDILQQVIFVSNSDTRGQAAKRPRLDSIAVREKRQSPTQCPLSDRDGPPASYRKAAEAVGLGREATGVPAGGRGTAVPGAATSPKVTPATQ